MKESQLLDLDKPDTTAVILRSSLVATLLIGFYNLIPSFAPSKVFGYFNHQILGLVAE